MHVVDCLNVSRCQAVSSGWLHFCALWLCYIVCILHAQMRFSKRVEMHGTLEQNS